jgi:hypothetical protein
MKPFRIYEVVAGGLEKTRSYNYKHDVDTLQEAEYNIECLQKITHNMEKQFVIMEYTNKYVAKIVKIIEPI